MGATTSTTPLAKGKEEYGAVQDIEAGETSEDDQYHDADDGASVAGSVASFAELVQDYMAAGENLVENFIETGEEMGVREFQGDTSIADQVFNLIKNLVGCGVLALPNGVGAFASAPSAVIPAAFYTVTMGAIFGYYFLLIGKTCELASATSYREVWEVTMGNKGAFPVAAVNMLKPALANLAYSMILADTFRDLFESIGFIVSRTVSLLLITVVALLPLCLLKNLSVLAPFSILGSLGMVFTALVMCLRYFDGTYDASRNGIYLKDVPTHLQPAFGDVGASGAWSPQIMVLVCMLFEAYVAHYNSPRFYIELERRSVKRFGTVVSYSFGASAAIYILMTTFGFLTFGTNCDGYILNNYSVNDSLATMCRVGIAFAIVFTYPIVFLGFRDGVFDLLPIPTARETSHLLNLMTVVLLSIVTIVAVFFDNLGLVNAVGGGTIATAIVFVFPTLMYRAAINNRYDDAPPLPEKREVHFAMALMWLGIAMGITGVWMAIADLHRSKGDGVPADDYS